MTELLLASETLTGVTQLKIGDVCLFIYVTVYRKTGHNAACVNIEKILIDFLKMYCQADGREWLGLL